MGMSFFTKLELHSERFEDEDVVGSAGPSVSLTVQNVDDAQSVWVAMPGVAMVVMNPDDDIP